MDYVIRAVVAAFVITTAVGGPCMARDVEPPFTWEGEGTASLVTEDEIICQGDTIELKVNGVLHNMAALNDAVFTRRRGSLLRAIDLGTGAVLWEHDASADGGLKVSPVVEDGHVLVIVGDRLVRMSLATGERDWQRPIPKDVFRQPNLRSVIYVKGPSVYDRLIATDEVVMLAYTPRNNPKARDTALAAFDAQTDEFYGALPGSVPSGRVRLHSSSASWSGLMPPTRSFFHWWAST